MGILPLQDLSLNGKALSPRLREQRHDAACPPHLWGCPVVMKMDPRSVAWTCASCGAIATTAVGAEPPTA